MRYVVTITETLEKNIIVDDEDQYRAIDRVETLYDKAEIVLDYNDYVGRTITAELYSNDKYRDIETESIRDYEEED